ncbi:hypothetical protein BH10ACT7_BH10ACT7_25760 [soil metagenome]
MTYTELFTQLVRAEIELWDALSERLHADTGVSVSQFQALSAVASIDGGARVQDISNEMSITVGATSKLVDRLERDAFVVRQSNPTDRRSSIVVLTDEGHRALQSAAAGAEKHLRMMLESGIPQSRAESLASDLSELRSLVVNGVSS